MANNGFLLEEIDIKKNNSTPSSQIIVPYGVFNKVECRFENEGEYTVHKGIVRRTYVKNGMNKYIVVFKDETVPVDHNDILKVEKTNINDEDYEDSRITLFMMEHDDYLKKIFEP